MKWQKVKVHRIHPACPEKSAYTLVTSGAHDSVIDVYRG